MSMNDQRLLDDLPRAHSRIQRGVRILKDHLHVAAARRACARREAEHVLAAERDVAGRRLDQPQDAAPGRALAAARLADEPERLALLDARS